MDTLKNLIRIRDDDVLNFDKQWTGRRDSEYRFRQIHRYCLEAPNDIIHVPTIVVEDLKKFPGTVEYIRSETQCNRMLPELHGLQHHTDCGSLPKSEVLDQLGEAIEWMIEELDVRPQKWYTPWGANSPMLQEVAEALDLDLIDCSQLIEPSAVLHHIERTGDLDHFRGKEVFIHWWNRGIRVRKISGIYKFGSLERAKREDDPAVWK